MRACRMIHVLFVTRRNNCSKVVHMFLLTSLSLRRDIWLSCTIQPTPSLVLYGRSLCISPWTCRADLLVSPLLFYDAGARLMWNIGPFMGVGDLRLSHSSYMRPCTNFKLLTWATSVTAVFFPYNCSTPNIYKKEKKSCSLQSPTWVSHADSA